MDHPHPSPLPPAGEGEIVLSLGIAAMILGKPSIADPTQIRCALLNFRSIKTMHS